MNYLNVTYEQLLADFRARLNSDPRFKNIGSATIYGMFQEMLCACMDMTNFYLQRTAEESFISTARLDSSVIKHGKGLGYNPRRAVPARCELIIRLKGPLPSSIKKGTEVFFGQETTDLSYSGNKYILDSGYSYVFTQKDVDDGKSNDWVKELRFSIPDEKATYLPLQGMSLYDTTETMPIKCFQGERKTVEILGTANISKIGEPNQFYDIDDLEFSDWYGKRDPFAYKNNVYRKDLSWCKVAVGADEDDAFSIYENNDGSLHDNTFAIETQAIHLNDEVVNIDPTNPPDVPKKVCLIDTNSDKTVRVSFSTEPKICDIGLKSYKDNVYVKYIATKGKRCNVTGVKGSLMTHNNAIKVNVDGCLVDITNNVQFIINSDIYGGEDFESQNSIRINAPAYFASCGKLVTKNDFTSYFRALTSPLVVQNALVYGQQEIEHLLDNITHKLIQNNIFYSILGHLYMKNDGDWTPRNILTETDNNNDAFSIYGEDYLNHLCDFIKMLWSYDGYYNKIFTEPADEQWVKNARLIYNNCKHKLEINSILMPMVPYVQYYDIVGTVYVDPLTDIEAYTNEMKNKVYEYLDQKLATERKIYKSEIINIYNKNDKTDSVSIDIKISDIVQSETIKFKWSGSYNSNVRVKQNRDLASYLDTGLSINEINKKYGNGWWNEIILPRSDQYGNTIIPEMFEDRSINLIINFLDYDRYYYNYPTQKEEYFSSSNYNNTLKFNISYDDSSIHLYPEVIQSEFTGKEPDGTSLSFRDATDLIYYKSPSICTNNDYKNASPDGVISMEIKVPTTNDFYSTSDLSNTNLDTYMLDSSEYNEIYNSLVEWLANLQYINSANRPIPLPYFVESAGKETRSETIERWGVLGTLEQTLSEQSFWNYFVPEKILKPFYSKQQYGREAITESTKYDAPEWAAATALIMDIYKLIKPGICDSILDDNNNIINFSTDMELPVLVNKIVVKPKIN